ncbi:MAG: Hpt domain-containing protein, partial [Rhodocyclaceae bacterium]|nr:Hpt domain-containing protein [Rhodocyclaceae bacterium]
MNSSAAAKLAEFRAQYLKQLNGRLAAIRAAFAGLDPAAWQVEQAQTLHRLVHGLTGSAGTFGLAAVSDVARRLENALANTLDSGQPPDAAAWQAILEALDRLARR